jgi:hypothetical protein
MHFFRPLDGDEVLLDEWRVLSEHNTVAEAYSRLDELLQCGIPQQDIDARTFQLSVADQFGAVMIEAVASVGPNK